MPDRRTVTRSAAAAAVILLLAGAGTYLLMRDNGAGRADEQPAATPGATAPERVPGAGASDVQAVKIVSNEKGYEPDRIPVRVGVPVRLTFVRTTDKTCGTEVIFPDLKIRRELPLNQPVVVELTPSKAGEIAFACGMNMLTGVVVVQ